MVLQTSARSAGVSLLSLMNVVLSLKKNVLLSIKFWEIIITNTQLVS